MKNCKVNLTDKHIKDFTTDDTIYINKMDRGMSTTYFCKFISYKRGIVTAIPLTCNRDYSPYNNFVGKRITARVSKCYLWGRYPSDIMVWDHCHWFKNGVAD